VGARQAEGVEQAHGVPDQVAQGVRRRARHVQRRAAGVTAVVADDEARAGRESRAQLLVPREHRVARPVNEHDRRGGGIAEGLDAQVDRVGAHGPLARRIHRLDGSTTGHRARTR
jgi:hypothetical protein